MIKLIFIAFTLLAALLTAASSNQSPKQLLQFSYALDAGAAAPLLLKSAAAGNREAAQALLAFATDIKSHYWLAQLASLPAREKTDCAVEIAESAYQLAMILTDKRKQMRWFQVGAALQHPQSQFELSLILDDTQMRFTLLEASASRDYAPAVITLAKYYVQTIAPVGTAVEVPTQDYESALYWLHKAAQIDGASAFKLAGLQWQLGNKDEAISAYKLAEQAGLSVASDYRQALRQQPSLSINTLFAPLPARAVGLENRKCYQQLQFVASNLNSFVQARQFKAEFEQDVRFQNIPICINPVGWLPQQALSCQTQAISNRIKCNLNAFSQVLSRPSFTHLVVFAPSGKAYVQRGIMYLDQADEYSVFIHELAHFANFVDEYALARSLAKMHCTKTSAPNLMLASADGQLDSAKLQIWQAGIDSNDAQTFSEPLSSDSVLAKQREISLSISPSRTCHRADISSFKPSADITFMEHHDTQHIPPLYLQLWRQQLANQAGVISAADEFLYIAKRENHTKAVMHWQGLGALK
jgi:hypothetical protein